jgi:hypothetical protein
VLLEGDALPVLLEGERVELDGDTVLDDADTVELLALVDEEAETVLLLALSLEHLYSIPYSRQFMMIPTLFDAPLLVT